MTVKQLAKKLNVSLSTVYHWVRDKKIPYYRFDIGIRFSEEEIEEWLRKQRVAYEEEEKERIG